MAELKITADNFEEEVIKSKEPILLDFWATWCGPCRMLSPVIEDISRHFEGRLKVGKINVDEENELANAFNVSSIPMLVIIKDGKLVAKSIGYMPLEQVEAMVNQNI